jgi:steroid 5-alpha reductase family enzyme
VDAKRIVSSLVVAAGSVALASGVAWAGSRGGATLDTIPIMALCAALCFVVQWLAFVPAYLRETERFYDLTGSLTYMAVVGFAVVASRSSDPRSITLALLVVIWAVRLGSFLFRRVHAQGGDSRFEHIKQSGSRFFVAWTLQGLWVFLTLSAALAAITSKEAPQLGWRDAWGVAIWAVGFAIEAVADHQKSRFRARNPGRFVHTGLWAWSRHPNYFGEIVLWIGIFVIASSALQGWQWVTMVSPLFVIVLLTQISGIPVLEKQAEERWGDREAYRRYKQSTPLLIPRPPRQ